MEEQTYNYFSYNPITPLATIKAEKTLISQNMNYIWCPYALFYTSYYSKKIIGIINFHVSFTLDSFQPCGPSSLGGSFVLCNCRGRIGSRFRSFQRFLELLDAVTVSRHFLLNIGISSSDFFF